MALNLTKFQETDFNYYYSLVSNGKVMAQITERAIPFDEAQGNFRRLLARNEKHKTFGSYKVCHSLDGNFIGLGHLTLNEEQKDQAEIGYMILPEYWGKGYGTQIGNQLIEMAKQTELQILKAIIDPANIASRKILIRQGFTSEMVCVMDGLPGEILSRKL